MIPAQNSAHTNRNNLPADLRLEAVSPTEGVTPAVSPTEGVTPAAGISPQEPSQAGGPVIGPVLVPTSRGRLRRLFRSRAFIALASALIGAASTFGSFIYTKWAERPQIQSEVVTISQEPPQNAVIDLNKDPDLAPVMSGVPAYVYKHNPIFAAMFFPVPKLTPEEESALKKDSESGRVGPRIQTAKPVAMPMYSNFAQIPLQDIDEVLLHAELPDFIVRAVPFAAQHSAALQRAKPKIAAWRTELTRTRGHFVVDVLVTNSGGKNISIVKATLTHTTNDESGKTIICSVPLSLPAGGRPILLTPRESQLVRLTSSAFDSTDDGQTLRALGDLIGTGNFRVNFTEGTGTVWPSAQAEFKLR